MKSILLCLILIYSITLFGNYSNAQVLDWGPTTHYKNVPRYFYVGDGSYFVVVDDESRKTNYLLQFFSKGEKEAEQYFDLESNGEALVVKSFEVIDNQLICFYSGWQDGKINYYFQKFNEDCTRKGSPEKFISLMNSQEERSPSVVIKLSENGKYWMFYYVLNNDTNPESKYGIYVFDDKFNLVFDKNLPSSIINGKEYVRFVYISDFAEVYLIKAKYIYEKVKKEEVFKGSYNSFYQVTGEGENEIADLEECFNQIDESVLLEHLQSDQPGVILFTGLIGSNLDQGARGVNIREIDFKKGTVTQKVKVIFSEEFILDKVHPTIKKLRLKKQKLGEGLIGIPYPEIKEVKKMGDDFFVLLEPNVGTKMENNIIYSSNELDVMRITNTNKFAYLFKILKVTYSYNIPSWCGTLGIIEGDEYVGFFNDDIDNYGSDMQFVKDKEIKSAQRMPGEKCGIAMAKIDLNTGEYQRKLITNSEYPGYAIYPFYSKYDSDMKSFFFFTSNPEVDRIMILSDY